MKDKRLLERILTCNLCQGSLPFEPRPVLQFSASSKILIVGQAPGLAAHESSKPWNDPSGDRLRQWLGLSRTSFYDAAKVALVPIGFCYPGKGKSGDKPPRKECAPTWHPQIELAMQQVAITLLVGSYAQNFYLKDKLSLTKRCKGWREYLPKYLVLPHPSPRNNIWLKKHPWFEMDNLPHYKLAIKSALE